MTTLLTRPDNIGDSTAMPGWNIVADLTPPELINLRHVAVLRRRIIVGLVLVVILCIAGYGYAMYRNGQAADGANEVSSQTADLTRTAAKYGGITRIEAAVGVVQAQVAGALINDVDVPHLIAALGAALPNTMAIQNMSLTLASAGAGVPSGGPVGLDASGHAAIGIVTISGAGRRLDDLPTFVDRLSTIRGVVNVVPSSNQVSAGVAQFSLTLTLTDQLYSHHFDVAKTGVK